MNCRTYFKTINTPAVIKTKQMLLQQQMNCRNVLFEPVAEQGIQSGADSQNKQRLRGIDAFDSDHRQQRHGKYGCNRPDLIHKLIQTENIKFRLITPENSP